MNVSMSEILLILLIALLVIKPEQLPDVAFSLGKMLKGVRKMFSKIQDEIEGTPAPKHDASGDDKNNKH